MTVTGMKLPAAEAVSVGVACVDPPALAAVACAEAVSKLPAAVTAA
jgi:hypothetical protein